MSTTSWGRGTAGGGTLAGEGHQLGEGKWLGEGRWGRGSGLEKASGLERVTREGKVAWRESLGEVLVMYALVKLRVCSFFSCVGSTMS